MNESINLVKAEESEGSRRHRKVFVLRVISIVFVSFVGIVSIILFILYARISVSSIKREQSIALQSITLQKNKLAKLNLLNDRLKGLSQVLKERKNYTDILDSLLEQIPSGASASALSIGKSGITLTVTSASLLPINKFLNNVVELSRKKNFIREMVIESLSIDSKTGTYSLSIKAKII